MKRAIYVFLLFFILLINVYPVKAQDHQNYSRRVNSNYTKIHSVEFDFKLLNFTYKEPSVGVKVNGKMYGVGAAYTYHSELMLKAMLDYYTGDIDYESDSGKDNNTSHNLIELRWLIGHDFRRNNFPIYDCLTPYAGFGYRYWKDDSGGKVTDLGKYGYDRETAYFYIPLGLEITKRLENQWVIGTLIEYDLFMMGKNKTFLSDVDPSAPNLEFDQDGGYGFRFSLKVKKVFNKITIGIVPFYKYWDIDKSNEIILRDTQNGYWVFYEPKNKTSEFGINLNLEL